MVQYIKKVNAMQFDGTLKSALEIATKMDIPDSRINFGNGVLAISGSFGCKNEVDDSDWVTRDNHGELLLYTDSKFNKLYEIDNNRLDPLEDKKNSMDIVNLIKNSKGVFPNG